LLFGSLPVATRPAHPGNQGAFDDPQQLARPPHRAGRDGHGAGHRRSAHGHGAVRRVAGQGTTSPSPRARSARTCRAESKRVYKRSEKAVRKAGKDTKKQTQRTGKHVARTVSPAERERQEAEKKGTP
jgi:hypothetical protein